MCRQYTILCFLMHQYKQNDYTSYDYVLAQECVKPTRIFRDNKGGRGQAEAKAKSSKIQAGCRGDNADITWYLVLKRTQVGQ